MQETVKDVMSREIIAVLPGDTAQEAARLMQQHNIGAVPVVSGGQLRGILTDRDIVLGCVAAGKHPDSVKASDLMTKDVVCVTPDQTVHDAVHTMAAEQVRRLPVVKDGLLDGIISVADIARRHAGPEIAEALSEISAPGMGACHSVKTK